MKLADIRILHQSDFYRIEDFRCHCEVCSTTAPEYNKSFSVSFIRKGFFEYQTFKRKDEVHVGRLLISKPGFEHRTRHIDQQPDIVTIFEFKKDFYDESILPGYGNNLPWLLKNNDIHSLMVNTTPELEYHHQKIFQRVNSKNNNSLEIDELVVDLLENVMSLLGSATTPGNITDKLKQYHLGTVEKARDYILTHFKENISLQQLAAHCLVSPFHFSRIFKAMTGSSPHQYLSSVRLTHARILLTQTISPVSDIAYECGFNSPEHFVTAFRQQYGIRPSGLRKQELKKQDF